MRISDWSSDVCSSDLLTFWLGIATLVALAAVSAATPFLTYDYWHRWFVTPGVLITAQVPLLTAIIAGVFFWSLRRGGERLPFLMALAIFFLGFVRLGVSLYPYIVPRAVTIRQAAAPETGSAPCRETVCSYG